MIRNLVVVLLVFLSVSCNNDTSYLPKPRVYPKVEFPQKDFYQLNIGDCPFALSVPTYMQYLKDSLRTVKEEKYNCWFDLHSKELNTFIHFSYVSFNGREGFDKLVADAFEMADKHNIKASYRDEIQININKNKVSGIMFDIGGPVASPIQFFLTDSTEHFVRGSLYFRDVVNRDSIEPVYRFVKEDFVPMFESFQWKN